MLCTETRIVRLERQPHRDAVGQLREVYQKLNRMAQSNPTRPVQEVNDDPDCSTIRSSLDPAASSVHRW